MGEWECAVCGYIHDGEAPAAPCPDCGAAKEKFVYYSYDGDAAWDDEELADDFDDGLDEDDDAGLEQMNDQPS